MTPERLFRRGLEVLGLPPDDAVIDRLCRFLAELQKWNRRMNLVADASPETLVETHFLDSLTLLPLIGDCLAPGLMDVGSGAGFPGLVLKAARPGLEVILVEPRQKRCAFLRQIIRTLELENIRVIETRLETDRPELAELQGKTPLLTSRALTSINSFLELATPFSAPGGRVICMKGRKADNETAEWREKSPASPYDLTDAITTNLPFSGTPRKLLVFTRK